MDTKEPEIVRFIRRVADSKKESSDGTSELAFGTHMKRKVDLVVR